MSDYTKVVIEADANGRMSISALDDRGVGRGYRLAGGKYDGSNSPLVARAVLDQRAVDEIRLYLGLWDEIHAASDPTRSTDPGPDRCLDCGCLPGQPHLDGCDMARCVATGEQRATCELRRRAGYTPTVDHDCGHDVWLDDQESTR